MSPKKQDPAVEPGFKECRLDQVDGEKHSVTAPVDLDDARKFLRMLDPVAQRFHFRTFPDKGSGIGHNYHGSLDEVAFDLQRDNGNGRGVFVVVNQGGTKTSDIKRIRACFADFDRPGAPSRGAPQPHMIVESSPGKHHYYWLIADLAPAEFKPLQQLIAAACGSDKTVNDPSRVMRLPGFIHHKEEPFRTRMIGAAEIPTYSPAALREAFGTSPPVDVSAVQDDMKPVPGFDFSPNADAGTVVETERHEDLLKLTAQMARHVVFDGMGRVAVLAAIKAEVERGRWSREMGDNEIDRALDGAIDKCKDGKWKPVEQPAGERGASGSGVKPDRLFRPLREVLASLPPKKWLIRNYAEANGFAEIFGEPGTGKSFLAVEWATCVAAGLSFMGNSVAQGNVLYIAGEGATGLVRRFQAVCQTKNIDFDGLPVFLRTVSASMTDRDGLEEIQGIIARHVEEFGPPALIIVDTVARNFGSGDENSTKDMNRFVAACDVLRECGACVCLIHHSGHMGKFRARGSSVLNAALDRAYSLEWNQDGQLKFRCRKVKDGAFPKALLFKITAVDLGFTDEDGDPVTSAVLQPVMTMAISLEGKEGRGPHQVKALELLNGIAECRSCLDAESRESEEAYMQRQAWRDACTANDIDRKRFSEVRKKFTEAGIIRIDGDKVMFGPGQVIDGV